MKIIQPDMKLDKQVRKPVALVSAELYSVITQLESPEPLHTQELVWQLQRARYTLGLLDDMMASACRGEPRPWSEFVPMIQEEFKPEAVPQQDHSAAEDAVARVEAQWAAQDRPVPG